MGDIVNGVPVCVNGIERRPETKLILGVIFAGLREVQGASSVPSDVSKDAQKFFESGDFRQWVRLARIGGAEITEYQIWSAYQRIVNNEENIRSKHLSRAGEHEWKNQ